MTQALHDFTTAHAVMAPDADLPAPGAERLDGPQKAAIIVRLLLAEGAAPPLRTLSDDQQARLARQMAGMPPVDRATLHAVIDEFTARVVALGLSFPPGVEGALAIMEGHISSGAAARLRRSAGLAGQEDDPWEVLAGLAPEALLPALGAESIEVAAVVLSRLPVPQAAILLGRLPGERARRIAFAMSQTGAVAPETVARIGRALAADLARRPAGALDAGGPVQRIGAILNSASSGLRDDLLAGLEESEPQVAAAVRRLIFTFAHIPARLAARYVARVVKAVDQPVLVTALASVGPREAAAAEFLLTNMSQRLAGSLRDEITERGTVPEAEGETAMAAVIAAIRALEAAGELTLAPPEAD